MKMHLDLDALLEDTDLPTCWEIRGCYHNGQSFSIANRYKTYEDAKAVLPILDWADASSLEIVEVWDIEESERRVKSRRQ